MRVLLTGSSGWLGRYLEHFRDRRWFPFKPQALEQRLDAGKVAPRLGGIGGGAG